MWKTVADLAAIACGCYHEDEHRLKKGNVVSRVRKCIFAQEGCNIGCAHVDSLARFFPVNGRAILIKDMKQLNMDTTELERLFRMKFYLDILKRRACGGSFPMDPSTREIRNDAIWSISLGVQISLWPLMVQVFFYADNPPKDTDNIRICDMFFLNADKFITDSMGQILHRVQRATGEKI